MVKLVARLVRHQPWRRTPPFRHGGILNHELSQPSGPFSTAPPSQSPSDPHPGPATDNPTSSVNADEISHFDALASTWWDSHGSARLLHLMNPLRHDFIRTCHGTQTPTPTRRDAAPSPSPSSSSSARLRYLDVGCGGGIFAESAARLPSTAHVTAIDPGQEVLAVARRHARADPTLQAEVGAGAGAGARRLEYRAATVETLPLPAGPDDMYDVVALWEVVEHVDHPADFLDRCGQFVKPGGWMVLSTVARSWVSWFITNLVAEDILGAVPKGTHDWNKYINPDELRLHFRKRPGWSDPVVQGVVYVPGLGWKEVDGSDKVGNYFFGIRKDVG